jgi:hypothetical protein
MESIYLRWAGCGHFDVVMGWRCRRGLFVYKIDPASDGGSKTT